MSTAIRPFTIDVHDDVLDDLRHRHRRAGHPLHPRALVEPRRPRIRPIRRPRLVRSDPRV